MNPLRQILQSLKHPSKSWTLIVHPNPKIGGLAPNGRKGVREYRMTVKSDISLQKWLYDWPFENGASNTSSGRNMKSLSDQKPMDPKWIRVFDNGQRNAKGQSVTDILFVIIKKFPKYELQSELGSERAIHDIESKLSEVASFKYLEKGEA